jgi:hypothetical protein
MDLTKIIAVSGRSGLFQMNAQTRGGVVATSLLDGKRIITSAAQQISVLSEIRIYCIGKEVPLTEVFEKMLAYEKGGPAQVKPKAPATDLEAYFFEVLEDYDEERVYPSDIKKIIQWYNLLVDQKIIALPKPKPGKKEKSDTKPKKK